MNQKEQSIQKIQTENWVTGLICVVPFLVLEGLSFGAGGSGSVTGSLIRLAFSGLVLVFAWLGKPVQAGAKRWGFSKTGTGVLCLGLITGLVAAIGGNTWAAWIAVAIYYAVLLGIARWLLVAVQKPARFWLQAGMIIGAGTLPAILGQVESRFSEEEYFVLLQALGLSVYGLSLWGANERLIKSIRWHPGSAWLWLPNRLLCSAALILVAIAVGWGTLFVYQHSFYPPEASGFLGISADNPNICSESNPVESGIQSNEVQMRIYENVLANPNKESSDYAFLVLYTRDPAWREKYHTAILTEARQGNYTAPANSVKYIQYQAAIRLYFYDMVRTQYPDLFTGNEAEELESWFAEINQRAMTVEWVDWLYALAFSKMPEGLYENQETGAGLLTLLEYTQLADPDLWDENRAYLERQTRGWQNAFRVTDDAYIYQAEWIYNAWFQSQRTGIEVDNTRLSFEWLLYQALPDGSWPGYNHTFDGNLTGVAYLGAYLLQDGRMLWLADQALDALEAEGEVLIAQPGMERKFDLTAQSPTTGSCLMYGNSGLPNQAGPLAADKLVFRDGWEPDDRTLLINLRFTGWHRYKATGSVVMFFEQGKIIQEQTSGQPYVWLPVGRSLFRDKRIPRENLNGLVVTRDGLGQVLYSLTGSVGAWAQDPPYYATVAEYITGDIYDQALIKLPEWHGWESWRDVTFYHAGPVVILDQALGPANGKAAIPWHLLTTAWLENGRVMLRLDEQPVEMLLLPFGHWLQEDGIWQQLDVEENRSTIWIESDQEELCLATILLSGDWVGAQATFTSTAEGMALTIESGDESISQPVSFTCSSEEG